MDPLEQLDNLSIEAISPAYTPKKPLAAAQRMADLAAAARAAAPVADGVANARIARERLGLNGHPLHQALAGTLTPTGATKTKMKAVKAKPSRRR